MRRKFRSANHCAFFAHGVANAEISSSDVADRDPHAGPDRRPVDAGDGEVLARRARVHRMTLGAQRVDHLERPEAQRLQRLAVVQALGLPVADDAAPVDDRARERGLRHATPDEFTCTSVPVLGGAPAPSACNPRPAAPQRGACRRAPRRTTSTVGPGPRRLVAAACNARPPCRSR